jgi:hypothetical protein
VTALLHVLVIAKRTQKINREVLVLFQFPEPPGEKSRSGSCSAPAGKNWAQTGRTNLYLLKIKERFVWFQFSDAGISMSTKVMRGEGQNLSGYNGSGKSMLIHQKLSVSG